MLPARTDARYAVIIIGAIDGLERASGKTYTGLGDAPLAAARLIPRPGLRHGDARSCGCLLGCAEGIADGIRIAGGLRRRGAEFIAYRSAEADVEKRAAAEDSKWGGGVPVRLRVRRGPVASVRYPAGDEDEVAWCGVGRHADFQWPRADGESERSEEAAALFGQTLVYGIILDRRGW